MPFGKQTPVYSTEQIYEVMRRADAEGDAETVRALAAFLDAGRQEPVEAGPEPTRSGVSAFFLGDGTRSIPEQIGAGFGDIAQGAGDVIGLAANPIGQIMNNVIGRDERYDAGQIMRDATGLPDNPDQMQSAITKTAASALGTAGIARSLTNLVTNPVAQGSLNTVGRTPIRDTVAGAAAGASAEAAKEYGPAAQFGAAILGGLGGYAGASRLSRSINPATVSSATTAATTRANVGRSAEELGITMLPAATGGTATRMATGAARTTLGEIPIAAAARRSVDSAQTARGTIAQRIGNVSDDVGAGQDTQRGLQNWIAKTGEGEGNRVSELFEAVPVDKATELPMTNTRQALTEMTAGLKSNAELSEIWFNDPRLQATLDAITPNDVAAQGRKDLLSSTSMYREAEEALRIARSSVGAPGNIAAAQEAVDAARIAMVRAERQVSRPPVGGTLSWADTQALRSAVGEIIGRPGLAADGKSITALRGFYGALTRDMEQAAIEAGPRALTMWRRAVQYKRGREDRIEGVLNTVLGRNGDNSAESVFAQINRWSQQKGGDFRSVARTLRSLEPEEANTIRSTILDRMGNASKGRQNADGTEFSPSQFVTEWNGLSPRARAMLFPEGEHRDAVRKLVDVMDAMKTSESYANRSGTTMAANMSAGAVLIGFDQVLMAGMLTMGSLAVGKLLSSNRLAQMLSRAPRNANPAAQTAYFERMRSSVRGTPSMVPLIDSLEAAAQQAANDNPAGRLAAEDENPQE